MEYSRHALQRMFARALPPQSIEAILATGEIIAEYPDDTPFPSALVLGFVGAEPVHVVVARDRETGRCIVITAYIPDALRWHGDFRTRRES